MLILLAAATFATATSADPPLVQTAPAQCRPGADKAAAPGRAGVRKLGEMPTGQQIRAVWRFDENGCPTPVVVRDRVGVNGR